MIFGAHEVIFILFIFFFFFIILMVILGIVFFIKNQKRLKECPFCAEMIQPEAIVCRFCGRDLVK